ncbi:hypothetical protein [Kocuria arenosa]|uniref:hypothetical protein n=1 Tax=Kocuria arenosa TaxID=3071446 RepID=UPI0034D71D36
MPARSVAAAAIDDGTGGLLQARHRLSELLLRHGIVDECLRRPRPRRRVLLQAWR